jgi:FtsH-binding integral membrane protein
MDEFKQLMPISALDQDTKVAFYKKTYTHLALAVLLFVVVEYIFFQIPAVVNFAFSLTEGWLWLVMLGGFMFATSYAERMAMRTKDKNMHYLGLLLYVVAEAFIFIPLIGMAMMYSESQSGDSSNLLTQAGIMTLALFTGLSAIVLVTKKDFSFLKSIMAVGFFVALGLILAAGSILYQTSNMVHKYEEDQYVAASLGLFASLMLLFWYIISIFMRD